METRRFALADGSAALEIAVDFGCNMCSWQVAGRELLYTCEGFGTDTETFYNGGNPLLFPAVGRTWDRSVTPPAADVYGVGAELQGLLMPCHGILPFGSWHELCLEQSDERVAVGFGFECAAEILQKHYPFDVALRQEFILTAGSVELRTCMANRGETSAPVAFGHHPYFRMTAKEVSVQLPCSERLELVPELLVPSGETAPFDGELRVTYDEEWDNGFGGMTGRRASLVDSDNGVRIDIDVDANIANFVIYSGPSQPFVCVEPWTAGLGEYEQLRRPDWAEGNYVPVLAPGESRTIVVTFACEEF